MHLKAGYAEADGLLAVLIFRIFVFSLLIARQRIVRPTTYIERYADKRKNSLYHVHVPIFKSITQGSSIPSILSSIFCIAWVNLKTILQLKYSIFEHFNLTFYPKLLHFLVL